MNKRQEKKKYKQKNGYNPPTAKALALHNLMGNMMVAAYRNGYMTEEDFAEGLSRCSSSGKRVAREFWNQIN